MTDRPPEAPDEDPEDDLRCCAFVLGDYSPITLTVRLHARSPATLFEHMPRGDMSKSHDRWADYSKSIDWHTKTDALIEIGNYIHELTHHIQYTCRPTMIHMYSLDRAFGTNTYLLVRELLKATGVTAPRLPLGQWLGEIAPEKAREWYVIGRMARDGRATFSGDRRVAEEVCRLMGQSFEEMYPVPFAPTLSDLAADLPDALLPYRSFPIRLRTLLESEATLIQFRYWCAYFGPDVAEEVHSAAAGGRMRFDYDALPLLAIHEGYTYLLPLLVDWALRGPISVPGDRKLTFPIWRFAVLWKAARRFAGVHPVELERNLAEVEKAVHAEAGLPDPWTSFESQVEGAVRWCEGPLRTVLACNLRAARNRRDLLVIPEMDLLEFVREIYIPVVVFRDALHWAYHPGIRLPTAEQVALEMQCRQAWTGRHLASLGRGDNLRCPFCRGSGYGDRPNAGRRPIGVVGDAVAASCHCGWAREFKSDWGFGPDDLHPFDPPPGRPTERV